ncbi:MAG: hypothetical protein F4W99_09290 [Chloroflexi bacterium]|nr:hypothetical protein [Chloroflexota bacterium]
MAEATTLVEASRRKRAPSISRLKRELDKVRRGDHTLASLSRDLGYADNYIVVRAQRSPELRAAIDAALIEQSEFRLEQSAGVADWIGSQIGRLCQLASKGKEDLSPADLDRLARALTNVVEVIDRTAAAARLREAARSGQGSSPAELYAMLAARWGPAQGGTDG